MNLIRHLRQRGQSAAVKREFWKRVAVRNGWALPPEPLPARGSRLVSFATGLGLAAVFAIDVVVGCVVLVAVAATSNWRHAS